MHRNTSFHANPDRVYYERLETIIADSSLIKDGLRQASRLNLPHWWIVGGVIRDVVWDSLTGGNTPLHIKDIDLIYFDDHRCDKEFDKNIEKQLTIISGVSWSVKNQARMHYHDNLAPYDDIGDAIYHFPETISSIAVKINRSGKIIIINMFGLSDLFRMIFRPTKSYLEYRTFKDFENRIKNKGLMEKWPSSSIKPWNYE